MGEGAPVAVAAPASLLPLTTQHRLVVARPRAHHHRMGQLHLCYLLGTGGDLRGWDGTAGIWNLLLELAVGGWWAWVAQHAQILSSDLYHLSHFVIAIYYHPPMIIVLSTSSLAIHSLYPRRRVGTDEVGPDETPLLRPHEAGSDVGLFIGGFLGALHHYHLFPTSSPIALNLYSVECEPQHIPQWLPVARLEVHALGETAISTITTTHQNGKHAAVERDSIAAERLYRLNHKVEVHEPWVEMETGVLAPFPFVVYVGVIARAEVALA